MDRPYIADRARYLKLSALTISEGMRAGSFRSRFRGHGMEFDGVREYERGDDIRSIDWNVSARNARTFVKMYREERELTVFLVVDRSLSMDTAPGSVSKREKALEVAALVAFAAEHNASPVGFVSFDGALGKVLKPRAGRDQVLAILSSMDRVERVVVGSALANALAGASRILRARSLVVIVSDFRTTGYEKALGILARRHDTLAIRVMSPADEALPSAGYVPFHDPETGVRLAIPTGSSSLRDSWALDCRESIAYWERVCARRGAASLSISTEDDSVRELSRFFSGGRSLVGKKTSARNAAARTPVPSSRGGR